MKLTEGARRDLESYLREIRNSLAGDPDVDAGEVVAGIREHVEAALSGRGSEPGTAEDLADVLERLGTPEQWADSGGGAARTPRAPGDAPGRASSPRRLRPEVAPLILMGAGGALALGEVAVPLGWGLIVAGAVSARIVLEGSGARDREDTALVRLTALLWQVSALAGGGALLFLPAVLIWGQSQTGGVLEPLLMDRALPAGAPPGPGERPGGYWPLVGLAAALVTGIWWVALGLLARSVSERLRRLLGPASWVGSGPVRWGLLVGGSVLLALSLLLIVGAVT